MTNFINYAHRGASSYAPENTLSAFKKAIELGANGIELDLKMTKDKKIVIFHDKLIDKKSNGTGKLKDYTYEELKNLDFGSWFDKKYEGEHIVLFEDFAKEFLNKNLTFAIELKVLGIEKEVLDIINKYKKHDNIYISSFKYEVLRNIRQIDNNVKISWLVDKIDNDKISELLSINGNQICPNSNNISKSDIELVRRNGLSIRLWGIDNEEIMEKVYNLDIDGMTVNFPDKLNQLLKNGSTDNNISRFHDNIIYETENFVVAVPKIPHIPRTDGGHLWIRAKAPLFESRCDFTPKLAIELMRLTMLVGESMKEAMKIRGINIEKINYQENGNWAYQKNKKPIFHLHLYGRVKNSVTQTFGEALVFPNKSTGFYDKFEPFNEDDILEIKKQIEILKKSEKYNLKNWNLK